MTRHTYSLFACAMLVLVAASSLAAARGQRIPLPPTFSGGSAGAWLGSGPLFGFDTPLGIDFPGGNGSGSPTGSEWDPIGSNPGGGGNGNFPCPGTCWKPVPVGPCTPMCDCYPSDRMAGVNECIRIDYPNLGTAPECNKDEFGLGCKYP